MIYSDAFNLTLLVGKIGIMIIIAILRGAVSMNGHSVSTLRCEVMDMSKVSFL